MSGGLVVHELCNALGDRVRLLALGARVCAIELQGANGPRPVVLGHARVEDYLDDRFYMGCTVGRVCNRIAGARFAIDGHEYRLSANEGRNHLHGGAQGFDRRPWTLDAASDRHAARFALRSHDGDQGYPGTVDVEVEYSWNDARELRVRHIATSDRATHLNLTTHLYFNLDGPDGDARAQQLRIAAAALLEVDEELIPTGRIRELAGGPLDLREWRRIDSLLAASDPLLRLAGGVDFHFLLEQDASPVGLRSRAGDLELQIESSRPGLQCYTGQHLRAPWAPFAGVCLEPQGFPDAPNRPEFPTTLLRPGVRYATSTVYRFIEHPL